MVERFKAVTPAISECCEQGRSNRRTSDCGITKSPHKSPPTVKSTTAECDVKAWKQYDLSFTEVPTSNIDANGYDVGRRNRCLAVRTEVTHEDHTGSIHESAACSIALGKSRQQFRSRSKCDLRRINFNACPCSLDVGHFVHKNSQISHSTPATAIMSAETAPPESPIPQPNTANSARLILLTIPLITIRKFARFIANDSQSSRKPCPCIAVSHYRIYTCR